MWMCLGGGGVGVQRSGCHTGLNVLPQSRLEVSRCRWMCSGELFYEQVEGAAMGSPLSPVVANLYMEAFEKTLEAALWKPAFWVRYVDDVFAI